MSKSKSRRLVREPVQVYLAPDDRKLLDSLARATGLSRAEILRRGIRSFAAAARGGGARSPMVAFLEEMANEEWPVGLAERHDEFLADAYRSPVKVALFLDTSGWLAAINVREPAHAPSRDAYIAQVSGGGTLVTTAAVIAEMHVLLLKLRGSSAALRFLDGVASDPSHEVIDVDRDLRLAAIERWLRRFADQDFSLTDAISFEVMRRRKLRRALALDQHFAAAGYELVPG